MTVTTQIVIAIVACTGFWEFVRWAFATIHTKRTADDEALLAILHEMVYPKLEECIIRQQVGLEEFDRIDKLAQPYFALGGNGTVRRRYEMVHDLPRIDDRREGYTNEH